MQTTLTRIFIVLETVSHGLSENSDEISRKAQKVKGFFRPKRGVLPKKKKKKRRSLPKLRLIFRPKSEIQSFYPPKMRWSSKKKKKKKKVFTASPLATLLSLNITTIVVSYFFLFSNNKRFLLLPFSLFLPFSSSPLLLVCLFVGVFSKKKKKD